VSKKWWIVIIIAIIVGIAAIVLGFMLPGQDSFLKNLLAEIVGLAFALAIAIWLIEGPVLTHTERLKKVLNVAVRSTARMNEEIAMTFSRDIGQYLASMLDSHIELYGEERGDWDAFKELLRSVFREARQVPDVGLPKSGAISESDYLGSIESARNFMARINEAIQADKEVQASLFELLAHWEELNSFLRTADAPYSVDDETRRYQMLGELGDILIDIVDSCPKIKG
jgi:hypothetical protein